MAAERPLNPAEHIVPDSSSKVGKKEQVAEMFNNIAGQYDFLNHFLSLGIDKSWRRAAIREVASQRPQKILDVATGTGDLALAASEATEAQIIGVDIAEGMLDIGREKIARRNLSPSIQLQFGDSEHLPFSGDSFDVVMCAYGVRNFERLTNGLQEMLRVLRPGGKLVILEFSKPTRFPIKQAFALYSRHVLPAVGYLVSKHKSAYSYLPESVRAFPEGSAFCSILAQLGYVEAKARPLTFGITSLYTANKAR